MERELVITEDGSATLRHNQTGECYHSTFGAYSESMHIFINHGLHSILCTKAEKINIFEVGLGTGLNCLLSAVTADSFPSKQFEYIAVEKYPLTGSEYKKLNYNLLVNDEYHSVWDKIHLCEWHFNTELLPNFTLHKIHGDIRDVAIERSDINLVYYDAFSPGNQPELWSKDIFKSVRSLMSSNSLLVTYSSKGDVKEALRFAGFRIQRVPGPSGKRHMIIAHID